MAPKEDCLHMSHPIFMVLNPFFCYVSPKIVIFHGLLIIETLQRVPLDSACLEPYICATQAIFNVFFPVKSTKCEIFA